MCEYRNLLSRLLLKQIRLFIFPAMNNAEVNILEHRHLLVLILVLRGECQRVEIPGQRVKRIYNLVSLARPFVPPGPPAPESAFPTPHHHQIWPVFANLTSRKWLLFFIRLSLLVRWSIFVYGFVILPV